jgi:acylphosphatase
MNMVLMKRVILHISGNVQQAGYRAKVIAIANVLDIKGNVQNLTDGRVKIVAEGEEADLERFIKGVNIKNTLINVSDIAKEYSNPTGDYERFYKLVGDGETDERLDTAADLLKELIHVSKSGFGELGGKIDHLGNELGGKIDHLGDELGGKIDHLGDELGGKIDQSRIEITSEIRTSREDLSSHFDERISMIEHDLAQIKAKVIV